MRVRLCLAVAVLGLTGWAARAADPPMPVDPRSPATMQRYMPKPQFIEMTITQDGRAPSTTRVCMDAATMLRSSETLHMARPASASPPGQGCTMRNERLADGRMRMERTCDVAAGANYTSHSVSEGTREDMRRHSEQQIPATGDRPAHTLVTDTRQRWLGDCPAGVKPGQMVTADGKVIDTAPLIAKAADRRAREAK
jgi:hypothetical protein